MTRAARSWLHVLRRKWRGRKRGPEPKIATDGAPRGAASRSQGTPGRLASAPPASVIRGHRCLASTGRLSALRHPSRGGKSCKPRAQLRRGNEKVRVVSGKWQRDRLPPAARAV